MRGVKALGQEIKDFDDDTWNTRRMGIVIQGNMHKFTQNPDLKEKLLATGDKGLAEASLRDDIWAIGGAW